MTPKISCSCGFTSSRASSYYCNILYFVCFNKFLCVFKPSVRIQCTAGMTTKDEGLYTAFLVTYTVYNLLNPSFPNLLRPIGIRQKWSSKHKEVAPSLFKDFLSSFRFAKLSYCYNLSCYVVLSKVILQCSCYLLYIGYIVKICRWMWPEPIIIAPLVNIKGIYSCLCKNLAEFKPLLHCSFYSPKTFLKYFLPIGLLKPLCKVDSIYYWKILTAPFLDFTNNVQCKLKFISIPSKLSSVPRC